MKKILIILLAFLAVSCSKQKLADMNKDIKHPATVPGNTLFSSAEKYLSDWDAQINVNDNNFDLWSQYLTETTYTDESNYNITSRGVSGRAWTNDYVNVLQNLRRADSLIKGETALTASEQANQANRRTIIDLLECYQWDQMVTLWGNIPYTDALNINNTLPAYDDAWTIHQSLITRVTADVAALAASSGGSFSSADIIYNGDISKWEAFGNGLLVKLGIQVADVHPNAATTAIKAGMAGAISSAADNAIFNYVGGSPNENPLNGNLVLSGRKDYVAANTIIDAMASLSDPRLDMYFDNKVPVAFTDGYATDTVFTDVPLLIYYNDGTKSLMTPSVVGTDSKGNDIMGIVFQASDKSMSPSYFLGGDYGYSAAYPNYSHVNSAIANDGAFPHPLMTYSEIQFYLAEAAARGLAGLTSTDAATYYNNAVTASFVYWGGTAAQAAAYLAQPSVAYNQTNWKQLIGTQAWISFYTRWYLSWTEWRRLDFPVMNEPPTPYGSTKTFPFRYYYPVNEQTLNEANWKAAWQAQGFTDDNMNQKLYWDVN